MKNQNILYFSLALFLLLIIIYIIYTQNILWGFYLIYLIAFIVYSSVGIYLLGQFGFAGDATRLVMIIHILISSAIIVSSFIFLLS